jgi:putative zinc finger/helix-turn-helix YgiT family protein
MPLEETPTPKSPPHAARPFPWRCRCCGKDEVFMATIEYSAEAKYDGRLYQFTIPAFETPVCRTCGEKIFTEHSDRQISEALRAHLQLLTPEQIQNALHQLDLTQKDAAQRLGIAEATLSRWLNESQIQSRSMDKLLRVFFAFPQVREALAGDLPIPDTIVMPPLEAHL